ncbi:MAG: ABC transporter ATP-binding protein [Candidatus Lokiarchaeota archaeon]|nr:ABC transporter ATP-binding protein [Candidatus Lokiarchaeota archaeon]
MNSFQMIVHYWTMTKKKFIGGIVLVLASTVFTLLAPTLVGRAVNLASEAIIGDTSAIGDFAVLMLAAIASGFAAFLLNRWARILNAEVASKALYYVRKDIYDAIYQQSFSFFDKQETGQLVARATSDVEQTEMAFGMTLNMGVQGLMTLGGVLVALLLLGNPVGLIFLMAIPASLVASVVITMKLRPVFIETRDAFGELTNTLRENIVGSQVVRIFSTQDKEKAKFARNNTRFRDASIRTIKLSSIFMPMNMVLISIMFVSVLYFGGMMIIEGVPGMDIGVLITLQAFAGQTIFPLIIMGQILTMFVQSDAALTRIREVIDSVPDIKEVADPVPASGIKGEVAFRDVSFGYTPSNLVLKNLDFAVPAGKKIAIIGTTGSGKSTIINLLPRFYDVSAGEIRIDGVNIKVYKLEELRKQIGIVSQDVFLFNKSILDNIRFGNDEATLEQAIEAAKVADIHEFIDTLPEKYDTMVGERGMRLSGGQKQRLSIARALLIKPRILVFDDSTSSVDVETEYRIQQALELFAHATTFIITQRISTIRNADLILVLDKGRVVGFGTHGDLIGKNALYTQIYETLHQKQKNLPAKAEEATRQ